MRNKDKLKINILLSIKSDKDHDLETNKKEISGTEIIKNGR